jgi:hypothetical protein
MNRNNAPQLIGITHPEATRNSSARALTVDAASGETLVPISDIAKEFCRCARTVKRWIADPEIGFPAPIRLNNRLYVNRTALEGFKRRLLSAALPAA